MGFIDREFAHLSQHGIPNTTDPFEGERASPSFTDAFTDAFTGDLLAGNTRTSADAAGLDAAAYPVKLVDGVVYKVPLFTGPSVMRQVPSLVLREFGSKREWIRHTKLYLQRLRTKILAEQGIESMEAFMAGANSFVEHALPYYSDLEFYAQRDSDDIPGEYMAVACHYLNGEAPQLLLWADGCVVSVDV